MADTLHRPPAEGSTPQDADIHHEIEPEQQRRRGPGRERFWIVAAVAVTFAVAALVFTLLLNPGSAPTPAADETVPTEPEVVTPAPPADAQFSCDLVRANVPC
jgi:hypothetical protein